MKDEADKLFEQCVRLQRELNDEKEKVKTLTNALICIKDSTSSCQEGSDNIGLLSAIELIASSALNLTGTEQ